MKNNIICFSFIFIVFASCSEKKKNDQKKDILVSVYKMRPQSDHKVFLSEIASRIEYIPLETNKNVLIHSIDKLEMSDTLFYLLDKKNDVIWCFNRNGKYERRISHKGHGPGEYIEIEDFILFKNQYILILDRNLRKIFFFDLNGKFVRELKLNNVPTQFEVTPNNNILIYTLGLDMAMKGSKGDVGYNLFLLDEDGKIKEKFFKSDEITDNLMGINVFSRYRDRIWFHYAVNDTIYEFNETGDKIIAKKLYDFGNHRIPVESIHSQDDFVSVLNRSEYARIINAISTEKFMYITYNYKMRIRFILHDMETNHIINGSILDNDIDNIPFLNPTPLGIEDNKLFFIKGSDEITKKEKDRQKVHQAIPALASLKEDDNPVVAIIHLKEKQ